MRLRPRRAASVKVEINWVLPSAGERPCRPCKAVAADLTPVSHMAVIRFKGGSGANTTNLH